MENSLTLAARQKQQQLLSKHQQQSLDLLHLPLQELEIFINREISSNPLLEELPPEEHPSAKDDPPQNYTQDTAEPSDSSDTPEDPFGDRAREIWGDDLPEYHERRSSDENTDFWSNSPNPPPSMQEQLASEIATSGVSETLRDLALAVVDTMDSRGYITSHPADLAMTCDCSMEEVFEAIGLIQSFDPPGIGARSLGECLKLQLKRSSRMTPLLDRLTDDDALQEIAANRLPKLAAELKVSMQELNAALAIIRKLDPAPGGELSSGRTSYLEPELEIIADGDKFIVVPQDSGHRRFFIPQRYSKMLEDPALSEEDKKYITEKLRSANELLKALVMRQDTLTGIGNVIIATQEDFLRRGPEALKPLTMHQAGEMIGRHETTISRAVGWESTDDCGNRIKGSKLIKTPQGIFPLKFFFSGGYRNAEGGDVSANAVMVKLRELIDREDPCKPLSDDKLSAMLKDSGLPVSRRTVTKYREKMDIPDSRMRKQFK